ncbi:MAG: response regulator, partial [Dechloromonas sp.]|nr:response regulator [Dechloromonas sp.]
SGIGIAEEKQALLFQAFSQADNSTTRKYGGTGLGLSIVRSLAELAGGSVGVSSEVGEGARFWFSLQAGIVNEEKECRKRDREPALTSSELLSATANTALASPNHEGCILVVEDNRTNRKVIEVLLQKLGLKFLSVENGQEAVSAFDAGTQIALVLMDCQMPVMDGFEATREIRQREQLRKLPRLPIVALTAGAFEEDRQNCLAAGMDDFLPKPVNFNALKNALSQWIDRT